MERKPVHGLAIRCITTLPTLHLWYGIICILSFGSGQHLFIKFTNLFNRYFACRHLSAKNKTNAKKAPFFLGKNSASAIQTLKVRPCVIHISVVVAVFAAVMSAESFAHPIPKSIPHTECFFSYTIKLAHSANNYPDYSHRLKCTIKPE